VTLDQLRAVTHPNAADPNDSVTLAAANLITLTATAKDGDGDTASAAIGIGTQLNFLDDGPNAANDTDSVAAGTTGPATGNVLTGVEVAVAEDANGTDGLADAGGADGIGRVTLIDNTANATAAQSVPDGGFVDVAGQYGTLRIWSNGDYQYTRSGGLGAGLNETFQYTMVDRDGDSVTATLTISIADAVPTAGSRAATLDDDALANGIAGGTGDDSPDTSNLTGNLPGSGGDPALTFAFANTGAPAGYSYDTTTANTLKVVHTASNTVVITVTLTNPATGAYTIVQNAPVVHAAGGDENNLTFSITYNVTDLDGDPAVPPGTLTINVDDDTPTATATAATTVTAVLDETATSSTAATLNTGAIVKGDDPNVAGTGRISSAVTGGAVVTAGGGYGADGPGTVSYALSIINVTSGLKVTDGAAINLVNVGGVIVGQVASGTFANQAAFAISINAATGVVTVEQYLSLQHPDNPNPDEAIALATGSLGVTITRTDSDGDSTTSAAADISAQIRFKDDGPTLGVIQNQTVNNDPAQTPAVGTLHFAAGADGPGTPTITYTTAGVTSGGKPLVTNQVGNVLTAYADQTGNGFSGDDTPVFTVTVNPTGGTSGTYTFDLLAPLNGTVTNTPIGGSAAFGAGPAQAQVLNDGAGNDIAIIAGWLTTAAFDSDAWFNPLAPQLPSGLVLDDVNGSTSGWGVDNNNFNDGSGVGGVGEFMRFDFGEPKDDFDGLGSYVPPAPTDPLPAVSYATIDFIGFTSSEVIRVRLHHTDGTSKIYTITGAQIGGQVTFSADGGKFIDWIDLYTQNVGSGGGKIDLVAVGVQTTTVNHTLGFTLALPDGDDDAVNGSFTVNVAAGNTPAAPVPPIVLDLDGDGVEFRSRAAGVRFDYSGAGFAVATAWAGADDGILAFDIDGNGRIESGREIVFGGDGLTDLQGLAAKHDSNHDGLLDANDADYAKFGVWQDANGNGVNDDGEFKSLADMGITSIKLTSDGKEYAAADGDVTVHGETTFTWANGTTGLAADASFAAAVEPAAGNASASEPASDVMAALLAIAPAAQAGDTAPDGDAAGPVVHALADGAATSFVDNLVNSLAGGESGGPTGGSDGSHALASLLGVTVDADVMHASAPFDMNQLAAHAESLATA
jgi:large repetitive protein